MNARTYLGHETSQYKFDDPTTLELDIIPNPRPGELYIARFTIPEFTSLCPQTGQPDFATIIIDYQPNGSLLESKALKLWMFAYRNHGAFHEDVTVGIGVRFWDEVQPCWVRVAGFWYPRGGIPIDVIWEQGEILGNCKPLDLAIKPYLGRV